MTRENKRYFTLFSASMLFSLFFTCLSVFGQEYVVKGISTNKFTISQVENQNIPGGDYKTIILKQNETCQACIDACLNDPNCKAYTYVKPGVQNVNAVCWLKSSVSNPVADQNCISGIKNIAGGQAVMEVKLDKPTKSKVEEIMKIASNLNISQVENQDIPGGDYKQFQLRPEETCQTCIDACLNDPNCKAYTYVSPGVKHQNAVCYLKSTVSNPVYNKDCISGVKTSFTSLFSKLPPDASSFYANASVDLLAKQLSGGQTLGNQITDSKDYNLYYSWAKNTDISRVNHDLTEKLNKMMDLKVMEGAEAKATWYALVCTTWANYEVSFGSSAANSTDPAGHKNWAVGQSPSILKAQIKLRLDNIFGRYGLKTVQGNVETWCEQMLTIPGLVLGMSNFAKDGGSKYILPDYISEWETHFVFDLNPVIGRLLWTEDRLEFYRLPSRDDDDPYAWKLPPGIVLGLTYNTEQRDNNDKVFGYFVDKGPFYLGGNKFKKEHGGDLGASSGTGWYWYESTGSDFTDWDMIQCLPRGTVVGLKHSINQKNNQFTWQGYTYDAGNPEISPPPGFLRRHYGDMGADENQGYSWYEKITDPPIQ